jgi:hypothetical protein
LARDRWTIIVVKSNEDASMDDSRKVVWKKTEPLPEKQYFA